MAITRKRTKAEIDYLNNNRTSGEKIPYDKETEGLSEEEKVELEKKEQEERDRIKAEEEKAEQERLAAEKEAKEKNKGKKKKEEEETEIPELEENQVLAFLEKTTGKKFNSINEVVNPQKDPTPEEIKAAEEKRESEKVAFGLQNNFFTDKQYKEFIADTKDPQALVFAQYRAEQLEEDSELTEEEIETEFNSKYGLDEKPESRIYKRGQKEIQVLADNIIRKKHENILNVDKEFTKAETQKASQLQFQNKVLTTAPLYKQALESVFNDIKTLSIAISKDEVHEVEVDQNILDEVKAQMLENDYVIEKVKTGFTADQLKEVVKAAIIVKDLPGLVRRASEKYHTKRQAGLRGVLPGQRISQEQNNNTELDERNKKVLERYGGTVPSSN